MHAAIGKIWQSERSFVFAGGTHFNAPKYTRVMRWFSKKTDMQSIYDACMKKGKRHSVSATTVSMALDSPFSIYCKYHVDPSKKDPPDSFQQLLADMGVEHEAEVIETEYPGIEKVSYKTPEEGFMGALQSMTAGTEAIVGLPIYYMPEGMWGYPDLLEICEGKSVFGSHHYTVREIKLAKNISEQHVIQAAFYAMILGRIQRRKPEYVRITNGMEETFEYSYKDYESLLAECIRQVDRIYGGWMPPAVYGTAPAPWSNYCNKVAIQKDDVSLIPGVGRSRHTKLVNAGLHTVQDVASSSMERLQRIDGIGVKRSSDYTKAARAIKSGKCVRKDHPVDLPERTTEIFVDLEGFSENFDDKFTDYLIGVIVRRDGVEVYHPFVAEDGEEDVMLERFLNFVDLQEDYVIYHWHNYERNHLRSMMDRYQLGRFHILRPSIMIDLYKVAIKAFAFPTYSNSIKDIAKWMGFSWQHADVGATSAMGMYLEYITDPVAGRQGMGKVIDYNRDDCTATRLIKDWLVKHG
ncbi:MAG: TM0106 family RecB-like putative nuclease [Cenarchaeum sp. SB0661_bin_35]|nr:TM0106 family RecB-like putative nuclease [Cenarchaeum sp. SB0667_bin_13]MXZ93071.1 TM0106 family RecB-like putative nuclease [Cenarchaeum sp. SB0666_bin_15]MYC79234.1 TM0106 family RecB-like putative nuclease [Cenarchaeum sp. SB0661_bin_35]MYD58329.1 TM0106 family RecB-like putative nuclease [Cenarchaeum sp. SB0678_bin_8]MYJ27665.1 TM0106 family RecB-like putative nuclease [Cenarchaeum sp. SB0672_bin_9]